MAELTHEDSVVVEATPEQLYDLVSDVARTGEWSPVCTACWWDEGAGPQVGSWFTGRNVTPDRTWETRSQVVVADRGKEFAFLVGGAWVRWGYTFTALDAGRTRLTESWAFLPAGLERFRERYGDRADSEVAERTHAARTGIPATLAALKAVAEREG